MLTATIAIFVIFASTLARLEPLPKVNFNQQCMVKDLKK